jgi:DNA-binding beta-propeller fold protein YncE
MRNFGFEVAENETSEDQSDYSFEWRRMQSRWQYVCCLLSFAGSCMLASDAAQIPQLSDAALARRIDNSPTLPFRETQLRLHASSPDWELGPVSGVAVGADGNLYVIQRGTKSDPVLVFDKRGDLLRSWGRGDFSLPHSLRLDPAGNVWALDAGVSKVMKYSPTGKKLLTIAIEPVPDNGSPFRGVTDLAFAPNGHVFMTDGYGNARILEYTANGKKVREWGHSGTGPAEFHLPHAIQISENGTVYVADRENGRIEKFDLKGDFLGEIDQLGRCYALKLDRGMLWASMSPMGEDPGASGWLLKLDPVDGKLLGHLAVPEQRVGHALDVLQSGEPVVTAGNGLLFFRRQ